MINKFINKRGFLLRDITIAALFGVGVIALFVILVGGVATNYSRTDIINPAFAENYNSLNKLTSGIDVARNSVSNSSSGISLIGAFSVTFNSFFTVVTMAWQALDIFGGNTASIISDFTFLSPAVIKILFVVLLSALVVSVIYIVISSVTRGRV